MRLPTRARSVSCQQESHLWNEPHRSHWGKAQTLLGAETTQMRLPERCGCLFLIPGKIKVLRKQLHLWKWLLPQHTPRPSWDKGTRGRPSRFMWHTGRQQSEHLTAGGSWGLPGRSHGVDTPNPQRQQQGDSELDRAPRRWRQWRTTRTPATAQPRTHPSPRGGHCCMCPVWS